MKKIKLLFAITIASQALFCTEAAAQNVNQFTGGFSYSAPVMTVPSPYGPGVSITANYGAGIAVGESSSEIGLGWGLGVGGMITRTVSGVPDDWNGIITADPQNGGFKTQGGVLSLPGNPSYINLDFYRSTYRIDTPAFYFPDYDHYNVAGPGISGSLQPHLFDFATMQMNVVQNPADPTSKITPYVIDPTHQFSGKPVTFSFSGDYGGDFKSRQYATTPINGSTSLVYPGNGDNVMDTEYPSGSTVPYTGVGRVGFDSTTNRLATAKYVETNGSTYFKITDESGFVYYFDLPVYVNSVTHGNYPLNNDYSMRNYSSSDTVRTVNSNFDYYIKDVNLTADTNHPYMIEWRQNTPYAYNWLLTKVTGPDYVDNGDGIVGPGDKGYWVTYEWKSWASHYIKRVPEYGFNYSFSPDESEKTQDKDVADAAKVSGKFGTFTRYDQDVYYLNKVTTASHTAILVRDVRLDDYSAQPLVYDNQANGTYGNTANIPNPATTPTLTSNYGTLYDDGGPGGNCSASLTSTVVIAPTGASNINVSFRAMNLGTGDSIKVLNGSTGAVLALYGNTSVIPANVTYNLSSIKIQEATKTGTHLAGFRLSWSSNVHTTVNPQLKVSRIVLLKNEDVASLPSMSNLSTSVPGLSLSGVSAGNFYNETWYAANQSAIEALSLQTVEFKQDYSLARKYYSNVKTIVTGTDKFSNITDVNQAVTVANADYANSGKLTLNEIVSYDIAHVKTVPSILFDYNASVRTDNPDFNPVKADYWGYYKCDASTQGYSGYTTPVSKDSTDAWSMRKITSPLGGTIEIAYESNQYEKVLDGNGGFRGPSKMYMIKSVSLPASGPSFYGFSWDFAMEEATEPSDFYSLRTAAPVGTVSHIFVPFKDDVGLQAKMISEGTFTFASATSATSISTLDMTSISPYGLNTPYGTGISSLTGMSAPDTKYTGNGYIHFDMPVGTAVYGGGIRVKTLTTKNGSTDTYVQDYTYTGGVTPMEADRFAEEKYARAVYINQGYAHALKLRAAAYDYHRMGPGVGYTTVTTRNLGQNNTPNGSTVSTFITSDAGIDNYKANIQRRTSTADHNGSGMTSCSGAGLVDTAFIVEVVNKFSGYWGQLQDMQSIDMNGNIVSRVVNEYSNPSQGSITENYDFLTEKFTTETIGSEHGSCGQFHHIVCIKRDYPVMLTRRTEYSQGVNAVTEYVTFDKITWSPTMIRLTTPNKGITVMRNVPAFTISQYAAMGPKSVTSTNANILSPAAYKKTTVDTTITSSSDFGSYVVQTFKKDLNIRSYDVSTSKYLSQVQTNQYWIADKVYNWAGANTSVDDYGLFKNSELPSTPFDYTLAAIDSKWQMSTENTLLDPKGHIIEVRGFNDRFMATKYGYGDTLKMAEASNVNYPSFTFCGFEAAVADLDPGAGVANYMEGEVKVNDGVKTNAATIAPHTGNYSVKVTHGTNGPDYRIKYNSSAENSGLQKNRTYRASVWVYTSSPSDCKLSISYTGATTQSVAKSNSANITIGNWTLMSVEITVPSSPVNNDELRVYLEPGASGDAYFDDLRLQPVEATVKANVYNSRTSQLMAVLDANNFATIYKYDAAGKVTEVWQEIEGVGLKRLKRFQYNYARGL